MRLMILALLSLPLVAQDPSGTSQQASLSTAGTAGRAIFQPTCGFCHGPDARGASGPDLLRSALVSHDVNGNLIGPVIRSGRPEKGMPAFQLSDTQIANIAAFLHGQAKIAASVAQRIPSEYPLEKLLIGNAAQGKEFFAGKGGCKGCHSVTGDLAHIAAKYKPFDLQTRLVFPAGAKPSLRVTTAAGETVSGEQVYADEFLVTLRDKNGWQHTFRRAGVKVQEDDPLTAHEKLLKIYSDKNVHDLFAYLETLK